VRQDLEASALRTALQSTAESDAGPNQRVMLVHAMSDWQYRSWHRKHPQVVSVAFAASAFQALRDEMALAVLLVHGGNYCANARSALPTIAMPLYDRI
jgi:hypothetical protein